MRLIALKNSKLNLRYTHLFLLLYIFLLGFGFLGADIDVCKVYAVSPNSMYRLAEPIGSLGSTLTINTVYIGQFLVSFLLITGLYRFLISIKGAMQSVDSFINWSEFSFLRKSAIELLIISYSWPLVLYSTNALRQGFSIALFFHILASILNPHFSPKEYFSNPFTALLLIFLPLTHSTGVYFLFLIVFSLFSSHVVSLISKSQRFLVFSILYLIQFPVILLVFYRLDLFQRGITHIVGMQLGIPLALMCLVLYGIVYVRSLKLLHVFSIQFVFVFSSLCISVIISAFNSGVAERLFVVVFAILMPYLIARSKDLVYSLVLFTPVVLTLGVGMYNSILANSSFHTFCGYFWGTA